MSLSLPQVLASAAPLELPITNPVLIVALAMVIFVSAPLLFERLRVPGIIGLIVAGAVVGPNALGLLARDATFVLLGTVGLLYLMFIAGVEIDLHGFQRYRNRSIVFGSITNLLPQLLGTVVGLALGYGWAAAILLASMFASHTLVSYPIASRLGISKNEAVTTAVGGTIITDTVALLVLAVIAASVGGTLDGRFWLRLLVALSIFVVLVLFGLPRLARWFFRQVRGGASMEFAFVLAALFSCAYLAEVAGVEAIIGAFLAGLALNRLIPEGGPLANRLHFFGNAFFVPFFLLSVGMLVDVRVLSGSAQAWRVMIAMTVTVTLTKWLAAKLTQRLFGYTPAEGWTMFGLSVPQAAATLAATLVGYRIGLFDDAVLNGSILMILVTCVLGPWVVERYGRQVALQEETRPYEATEAPQRVLIPMSNPATAEALLDLAFLLRSPDSGEPLYPLTVVPDQGEETEAHVAAAEKLLSHAVIYAAGAEVPVVPLTRVDHNSATGIVRGIAETRSSVVIVGWDARRSPRQAIFGSVLDQLLEQTRQLVLVAKLGHPLNVTKRIVLVLPAEADHLPGFSGAARLIKGIAHRLGATLTGLVVSGDPQTYDRHFKALRPQVPASFAAVAGWDALLEELRRHLAADDLVVVVSARRGTLAWHRELERLPGRLAELVPESFLMLYPSEIEPSARSEGSPRLPVPYLQPEKIVFDLPPLPLGEAIGILLGSAFNGRAAGARHLADQRLRSELEWSGEVLRGVVVPHARIQGLTRPMLVLGISPRGIRVSASEQPAHLIFLLLSPAERPEEHLRYLAEIARLAGKPDRLRELLERRTPEEIHEWFRANHL